ncbi:right-handed parallel beta-helix repeat-containing protein [Micromonospora sp. WMMA1363]|uniref:right-handed parallel beta-helix repeat-containing protein n=1 Tax=Micromonospora sp. WMMA1363 TaxID=3053985 RepID=UPI00259C6D8D|nr:right-handed parallel beta-helix repeat-containing protein [Micromonospora sp. WMMA1363]MDM4720027.1 right-handed parallel beta-helix repeat-containing protein [Micromonospora sp. WMMA1363]
MPCDPNALIAAITTANSAGGGTLDLARKCTYTLTANQDGNGLPVIVQPITIKGNGSTIARAANADQFRFFEIDSGGILRLKHLTLTRGKTAEDDDGGAVYVNVGGKLDLDHTTLDNNTVDDVGSDDGGAVFNDGGIVTIRSSTLKNNSASLGGAIFTGVGELTVTTSKLISNTSDLDGGAIYGDLDTVTVSKSRISHNHAGSDGGGIYSFEGALKIDRSAVTHNTAGFDGGGIFKNEDSIFVFKSTIAGNLAADDGGGMFLDDDGANITESKILNNTAADGDGGGVYVFYVIGDTAAFRRTVISGNQALGADSTGGGIHIEAATGVVALTDVKITNNTATDPAGGVENNGTVTSTGKVIIVDNVPTNCANGGNPVPGCFG